MSRAPTDLEAIWADVQQTLQVCSSLHYDGEQRHWHVLLEDRFSLQDNVILVPGRLLSSWSSAAAVTVNVPEAKVLVRMSLTDWH